MSTTAMQGSGLPNPSNIGSTLKSWLRRSVKAHAVAEIPEIGAAIGTTIGEVRKENQDRAVLVRLSDDRFGFTLAVLCDGMGGMRGGAECAEIALITLIQTCLEAANGDARQILRTAVLEANAAVYRSFKGDGGTTIAAVLGSGVDIDVATVGDTRVYRQEADKLTQLSHDDTIAAELKRIRGPEVVASLLDVSSSRLAQFVGLGTDMEVRTYPFARNATRAFVLASDGAYDLPAPGFELILQTSPTPFQSISRVLQTGRWCGGKDNATMIYVPVDAFVTGRSERLQQLSRLEVWDSFGKLDLSLSPAWMNRPRPLGGVVDRRADLHDHTAKDRPDRHREKNSPRSGEAKTTSENANKRSRADAPQRELRMEISSDDSVTRKSTESEQRKADPGQPNQAQPPAQPSQRELRMAISSDEIAAHQPKESSGATLSLFEQRKTDPGQPNQAPPPAQPSQCELRMAISSDEIAAYQPKETSGATPSRFEQRKGDPGHPDQAQTRAADESAAHKPTKAESADAEQEKRGNLDPSSKGGEVGEKDQ